MIDENITDDSSTDIPNKSFNINFDFDLKNSKGNQNVNRKTGVDIDLLITSSATTSKHERYEERGSDEIVEQEHSSSINDYPTRSTPQYSKDKTFNETIKYLQDSQNSFKKVAEKNNTGKKKRK